VDDSLVVVVAELVPDVVRGEDGALPVSWAADADFEMSHLDGELVEEIWVDAIVSAEVVVGGGVAEDLRGDAFFDCLGSATVFVFVDGGVAASFAGQQGAGDR
jgi:hypothetical protein